MPALIRCLFRLRCAQTAVKRGGGVRDPRQKANAEHGASPQSWANQIEYRREPLPWIGGDQRERVLVPFPDPCPCSHMWQGLLAALLEVSLVVFLCAPEGLCGLDLW